MFINALANQASHFNNRMQKFLCIYFKAKGVPKSIYHLFRRTGIVESYQWSLDALTNISEAAMTKASQVFEDQPGIMMHDNVRLPFPVKHQRNDHQTVTDNGTAITMLPMRNPERACLLLRNPTLWDDHMKRIIRLYRQNKMQHLTPSDIISHPGFVGERQRMLSNIIRFLFDIPAIKQSKSVKESGKRFHELITELKPVRQLPWGPEHRNKQYMLQTIPQEEATYGGNYAITKEAPRQLGITTDEELEHWASTKITPWVGDSLTTHRLRWLQRMKVEDPSILERLGHIIVVFGWLHLDMNLANGIFYHHYAEESQSGLALDAAAMRRAGLTKPTKRRGPQYHTLDEFLRHSTTARMRGLWNWATDTSSIEELTGWVEEASPEVIRQTAERIWADRCSNRAFEKYIKKDSALANSIALNRDLLLRHEVWDSTRRGDVGRMDCTLPSLLVFFLGAGASNYAREIAELLHWQKYEAPPGVA